MASQYMSVTSLCFDFGASSTVAMFVSSWTKNKISSYLLTLNNCALSTPILITLFSYCCRCRCCCCSFRVSFACASARCQITTDCFCLFHVFFASDQPVWVAHLSNARVCVRVCACMVCVCVFDVRVRVVGHCVSFSSFLFFSFSVRFQFLSSNLTMRCACVRVIYALQIITNTALVDDAGLVRHRWRYVNTWNSVLAPVCVCVRLFVSFHFLSSSTLYVTHCFTWCQRSVFDALWSRAYDSGCFIELNKE